MSGTEVDSSKVSGLNKWVISESVIRLCKCPKKNVWQKVNVFDFEYANL